MQNLVFAIVFLLTVGSACVVAFSRNLVYSAFALLGTFAGVAISFVMLNAAFVGLVQLVVYAGGILVLTVFAVMLTTKIGQKTGTNPVMNYKIILPLVLVLAGMMVRVIFFVNWTGTVIHSGDEAVAAEIGKGLLSDYLLPFELISVVLLVVLLGAVIVSRRRVKE